MRTPPRLADTVATLQLDRAVLACYAATDPAGGWDEAWADVWKDTGAGPPPPKCAPDELKSRRAEVDQLVLAALVRLNHERAERGQPRTSG